MGSSRWSDDGSAATAGPQWPVVHASASGLSSGNRRAAAPTDPLVDDSADAAPSPNHAVSAIAEVFFPQDSERPGRLDTMGFSGVCDAQFAAYTGVDYFDSPLVYTLVAPSEELWAIGDRRAVCVLHRDDFGVMVGSEAG